MERLRKQNAKLAEELRRAQQQHQQQPSAAAAESSRDGEDVGAPQLCWRIVLQKGAFLLVDHLTGSSDRQIPQNLANRFAFLE